MTPALLLTAIGYALLEETVLRDAARIAELDPERADEAFALYARANGLRKVRIALMERLGLPTVS